MVLGGFLFAASGAIARDWTITAKDPVFENEINRLFMLVWPEGTDSVQVIVDSQISDPDDKVFVSKVLRLGESIEFEDDTSRKNLTVEKINSDSVTFFYEVVYENERLMFAQPRRSLGSIVVPYSAPWEKAAYYGKKDEIKKILQKTDPNITDRYGRTPLMIAAFNGHLDAVKKIRSKGGNVNASDYDNVTALMLSVKHKDVAKYLLKKKADVNAIDKLGRHAVSYAINYPDTMELLYDKKAEFKGPMLDKTLVEAVKNGDPKCVKLLCEHGADPNANMIGRTTLTRWAIQKRKDEAAQYLLRYGGKQAPDEKDPRAVAKQYGME